MGIFEINQLNISSASQILEKVVGEILSEGELIFYNHPNISSLLAFW